LVTRLLSFPPPRLPFSWFGGPHLHSLFPRLKHLSAFEGFLYYNPLPLIFRVPPSDSRNAFLACRTCPVFFFFFLWREVVSPPRSISKGACLIFFNTPLFFFQPANQFSAVLPLSPLLLDTDFSVDFKTLLARFLAPIIGQRLQGPAGPWVHSPLAGNWSEPVFRTLLTFPPSCPPPPQLPHPATEVSKFLDTPQCKD